MPWFSIISNKPKIECRMLKKIIFFLEKYLGALLILIIGSTYKIKMDKKKFPNEKKEKCIYTFWHCHIFTLAYKFKFKKAGILISSSQDGQFIAGPVSALGFKAIRGSSSKNAVNAIKNLVKYAKFHHIAITPDGPRGPKNKLKKGVFFLAYNTKLPIVALNLKYEKAWRFNSWDKFVLPKPFSKIYISYEKPIFIKSKEEIKDKFNLLKNIMNK